MKKRMFRVLCVVLALALLAPNVFAATPPAEVLLADEATVTRVKNEIATGEITDVKDVFLVAYQHLGADLEEEGMTAYINEDGTLGFTQVISSNGNNARSDGSNEAILAVTSVLLVDEDGQPLSADDLIYGSFSQSGYAGLDSVMIYAANTIRIQIRYDYSMELHIRLTSVSTAISYGSDAFTASNLTQSYETCQAGAATHYTGSRTLGIASAGTYTYSVAGPWHNPTSGCVGGFIKGSATIYVANSNLSFQVNAIHNHTGNIGDYLNLLFN